MTEVLPGTDRDPATLPTHRDHPFDPPADLGRLRRERPLCRLAYPDGHLGWLVTEHALAKSVLADKRFSARMELRRPAIPRPAADATFGKPARPGFFIGMDPPDHTQYRRLLTGQFTVRRMNQLQPRIERIVADHLDAMAQAGPPADLVPAFALPIPSLVICELLGVPYGERNEFQDHTATMLRLTSTAEQANAARESINDFLRGLVVRKRQEPTDDLLGGLVAGGGLTDEELVNIGFLLLVAGHETTANMLALGTLALLRHPEQLAALRADPALVDGAVEELLRYLTIVQFGTSRTAIEDVELAGRTIRAGECVSLSLPAANRDPGRFDRPDELDLTRTGGGHLAFGHGVHQCLGQQLARMEMRIGFRALVERFPTLRLAAPVEQVRLRHDMAIYGVHELPVTW